MNQLETMIAIRQSLGDAHAAAGQIYQMMLTGTSTAADEKLIRRVIKNSRVVLDYIEEQLEEQNETSNG